MRCKALETIRRYGMLQSGHVLLGLSGGADSMSLLHLLCSLREEYGFTLEAAHVHHGLRGAEADRDERFVRAECAARNVPLHVLHTDIAAEASRTGESLEACGRRVRYDYFWSLAKGEIATAHTADDNAETILLHLIRGSGTDGLRGIRPVRGSLIRPLIECTRADVERYCAENAVPFVTDSSNLTDAYSRNRVRRQVLPQMREINPAVNDALLRCASLLDEDADYLGQCADALLDAAARPFGYDAATLLSAHPALTRRAVRRFLSSVMRSAPLSHHVLQCVSLLSAGGAVQTEQGTTVCVYGGLLYVRTPLRQPWTAKVSMNEARLPFAYVKIQKLSAENIQNIHKDELPYCLCCDTIHNEVFFRSRLPGDRMTRVGGAGSKPIKKLFEELGVPACLRNDVPILTDGTRILWAEGIGCNAPFACTPQSKSIWKIQVIREDER
ncbi:MAG: tRNA lysidine(34) synthetase TilS [Clostridia bacterium]|nr:tRNA lysidine(34) synthetase TilS [Clostridia bacterium]